MKRVAQKQEPLKIPEEQISKVINGLKRRKAGDEEGEKKWRSQYNSHLFPRSTKWNVCSKAMGGNENQINTLEQGK